MYTPMTQIETERLSLRPFLKGEAALIHRLIDDTRVFYWLAEPGTLAEAEDSLENSMATLRDTGLGFWAVFAKGRAGDGSAFLGQVGLHTLRDSELIELSYHFTPEAWGHGYATEAAIALLDHGFRTLHLDRIVAAALPDNKSSLRVLQRLGLPYIEDRMHAGLNHQFYALTREANLKRHHATSQET